MTPRCDEYEVKDGIRYVSVPRSGLPDWPSFARQLERELAQAQARCAELEKEIIVLNGILRVRDGFPNALKEPR